MTCISSCGSINICILLRPLPLFLLFNGLLSKACHYSLIVTKFLDRYIQVRDNEIVDSASLQSDRVRYMQVNLTVNIRGNFWEVAQLYTGPLYTGLTVYTYIVYSQLQKLCKLCWAFFR